ncbi:hypothetical protein C4559_02840 [Candidatus Microgenomates bacterium]|nr:MAG: hypothetical protein C4559_02840 [Candidatus Microgenomates bacterium]
MNAIAIKLYGLINNEKSIDINIDLSKYEIFLDKKSVLIFLKKIYKKTFIYHFYKVFSTPIE